MCFCHPEISRFLKANILLNITRKELKLSAIINYFNFNNRARGLYCKIPDRGMKILLYGPSFWARSKDCSPKLAISCTLKKKIKKIYRLNSYARVTEFYQQIENSGRTNQICGFPIKHNCVFTNTH